MTQGQKVWLSKCHLCHLVAKWQYNSNNCVLILSSQKSHTRPRSWVNDFECELWLLGPEMTKHNVKSTNRGQRFSTIISAQGEEPHSLQWKSPFIHLFNKYLLNIVMSSPGNRFWAEICIKEGYWGVLLRTNHAMAWGKQNWSERVELGWICPRGLNQSYPELWSWPGKGQSLCLRHQPVIGSGSNEQAKQAASRVTNALS